MDPEETHQIGWDIQLKIWIPNNWEVCFVHDKEMTNWDSRGEKERGLLCLGDITYLSEKDGQAKIMRMQSKDSLVYRERHLQWHGSCITHLWS